MDFHKHVPPILYKYRDWSDEYQKRLLTDGELYFASADQFNDPFDCSIPFRYKEEELTDENLFRKYIELAKEFNPDMNDTQLHQFAFEAHQKDLIHDSEYIRKTNEHFSKRFNKEWGILSLTPKDDNFLMWSHYSRSHSGFCVGLNSYLLYKQVNGIPNKVIYETEFPEFGLFDDRGESFVKSTFYKSEIWEYEDEYRIVKNSYSRKVVTLSPDILEEIIFGAKMEQSLRFELLELINDKYPDARVYEFKLHGSRFEMVKTQIR